MHTLPTRPPQKGTPPPLPKEEVPIAPRTFNGVKIDIAPGQGPSTHLTVDETLVRYEPFWEPDGTKKSIVHVRGLVRESYISGLPEGDKNPLVTSGMEDLYDEYAHCEKCPLYKDRAQVVFGDGNQKDPKILIVGEAPGPDEDKHGRPFIGRTGQKLRNTLKMVGIDPDRDCYITNAVCCFPYDPNAASHFRGPKGSEILACRPRLTAQAKIIKPSIKVVLCLGKRAFATFARPHLMKDGGLEDPKQWDQIKLGEELGWYTGPGSERMKVRMYTTFHPSFIARLNQSRARAQTVSWQLDLKAVADYALKGEFTDPRVVKP